MPRRWRCRGVGGGVDIGGSVERRWRCRGQRCCNRAGHGRLQQVSGGDQHPLLLCFVAAVERDGIDLEAGGPVGHRHRLTQHAVGLSSSRLRIDQAVVSMRVRRCAQVEMAAHLFVVEAQSQGLLDGRKEILLRERLRIGVRGPVGRSGRCAGRRIGKDAIPDAEDQKKDPCRSLRCVAPRSSRCRQVAPHQDFGLLPGILVAPGRLRTLASACRS